MAHSNTKALAQCSSVSLAFINCFILIGCAEPSVTHNKFMLCKDDVSAAVNKLIMTCIFLIIVFVAYSVVQVTYTGLEHTPLSFL